MLIANCASAPAANPDEVSLNTAIRQAAARMESRLPNGTKVALINFTSPSQVFSEYVLDELSSVLVNNGQLVVVDRANLDKIREELGFNVSGEVSDASMQEIGQMLEAQALVTGSLTSIGDLRRIMFKTIMTETRRRSCSAPRQHNQRPADKSVTRFGCYCICGDGFGWAAQLCDIYEYGGFNDWFLPSRDELNFMYGNLYLRGLGNFRQEQYWASTTWTDTWGSYRAWYINFADGKHDNENANRQRRVRAVRQF